MEFGPVAFGANPAATSGVRSLTDQFYEGLRARNVEVLLLGKRIDAWVMDHLQEFEGGRSFIRGAARGEQGAFETRMRGIIPDVTRALEAMGHQG